MLRKIRQITAIICFTLITLLFLDFTGTLHAWFGWLANIQFLPALFAINIGVIVLLILLTVVFGRIYCSIICPLGVFQDVIARIGRAPKKRRKLPYSYSPSMNWLRYGVLGVFVVAIIAQMGSLVALLAPYSSYGRIANTLFQPLWQWGNNLLAYFAEQADSYAFYQVEVWLKSLPTLIVAIVTLFVIIVLAGRNGRTYCNTVCPVGTILGFLSRYSLFRIIIDTSKCNSCTICARNCKAACINHKEHEIDYSRCVVCMDCIEKCKHGAISYAFRPIGKSSSNVKATPVNATRRSFFSSIALAAATSTIMAKRKKVDGGLARIEAKKIPKRNTAITPAGSLSARNMASRCTACQLCVSTCPNQVLRPSTDLIKLMQPEMSYERGYCRPECTQCSDVCPTGAIQPISKADKSSTQIGHAVWIKENCIPMKDEIACDNCGRHCPVGAIQMVDGISKTKKVPVINVERCIGCGACENLCPARPFSAIYIEGHDRHRVI